MAQKISLRDYQRELAERLRNADSARAASKLGVQVGEQNWLIDLAEAGEVMPVPAITPVPLTRPWFKGVANVRGNLYSVVDFAEFLGTGVSRAGEQARLVLLGERFRSAAALLVDRSLGLRNPAQLRAREPEPGAASWLRAEYEDEVGARWSELDVVALVGDTGFLAVGN
ncbi:MAG TPA: chemotaxis protein CheW [Burkholderiales bacterium]|jgi:twitching motility protein PilI|nr:chemotaxis protein CheW [Burkholderiales bacterium]